MGDVELKDVKHLAQESISLSSQGKAETPHVRTPVTGLSMLAP